MPNSDVWRIEVTRALGNTAFARAHARHALDALGDDEPVLPRYPAFGHIVTDADTITEMRRLAAG